MPHKILLSLCRDDSDESVLEAAKTIAKTTQSEITLLYANPEGVTSSDRDDLNKVNQALQEAEINTGQPVLVKGDELDEAIRTLKERAFNLVIMAVADEGDRDAARKINIKLIRKTEVPVWEVKPGSSAVIDRVLCPVDFSEHSERALKNAIALTSLFNSELQVLSVYEPPKSTSVFIKEGKDDFKDEHQELLDSFLKNIDFNKVQRNIKLRSGQPTEEIIAEAKDFNANLLIMGSAGRSGIHRKAIGSTTEKIITDSPCSVIVLREQDIFEA